MSRTIDERVVSMQFDNKNFESNVQTSLGTLEKLKQSLKLKDASKGLESVSAASKKCDFSAMGRSADKVGLKFSAMYTMADQAFRNIYNSAEMYAKRIVSAFTIDPVKTGFSEYETQINAVQTILANTQSKGTTLDDVNRALDTLNTYADKTIYNFTEMTRNIGTFTAAGVDLDTSVNAIQGIANLAAVSGSSAQQASTAMYQLSQALASGTVKLMDWNSVVNAGMGGQVFQDALKETARIHGVAIDEMIKDEGSFRDTLKNEWLTTEILTETLQKFTLTTEGLTDAQIEQNRAMLKSKGYTDAQINGIFELGKTATDAATKVKTFTQLMDTLKEAAQSGWTQTWELIVGDFEEAKTLWTNVSDIFGKIINDSAERRNKLLGGALKSNWEKITDAVTEAGVSVEDFEKKVTETAKAHGHDIDALIKEYGSLEKVFKSGAVEADVLKEAVSGISTSAKEAGEALSIDKLTAGLKRGAKGDNIKQLEKALETLGYNFTGLHDKKYYGEDGYFGTLTEDALKAFQKDHGLKITGVLDEATLKALDEAVAKAKELTKEEKKAIEGLDDLIDSVMEDGGRELLLGSFKNIWEGLKSFVNPIKEAFRDIFPPLTSEQLRKWIEGFHELTSKFKLSEENGAKLKTIFSGLFSVVKAVGKVIGSITKGGFKVFGKVLEFVGQAILDIGSNIQGSIDTVKGWIDSLLAIPQVKTAVDNVKNAFAKFGSTIGANFGKVGENIKAFFERVKALDSLSLENVGAALNDFYQNVIRPIFVREDGTTIFDGVVEAITNLWNTVTGKLSDAGAKAGEIIDKIAEIGVKIGDFFKRLGKFVGGNLGNIGAISILIVAFMGFKKLFNLLQMFGKPLEVLDNVGDVIESFGKTIKSFNLAIKGMAMESIAKSIAILVGSLLVLAFIPAEKLWPAIGAMVVVMGALAGLMWVMGKINGDTVALAKMAGGVAAISGALLLFALAATAIALVKTSSLLKAGGVILGFVLIVKLLGIATKGSNVSITKFGLMMLSLSFALTNMALAIGLLGSMKLDTLAKGIGSVALLLGMIAGLMYMTKFLAPQLPKFGTTMMGISAALLLMSASVGILGKMKFATLLQGGLAVGVLLAMIGGLMYMTKFIAPQLPKFGACMTGIGVALIAMSGAIAILGNMDAKTLIKGYLAIAAIMGLMISLMAATKLMTAKGSANAGKIGLMMLSFALSMTMLTASIALLSFIEIGALAKALAAIAVVGAVFAGLMVLTKFAKVGKGVKATLMTLSICIGVLAISIAALSFIDTTKLKSSALALGGIIAMFALLVASTKLIGVKSLTSLGILIALAGTVVVLGGVVKYLADIPAEQALGVAKALSLLLVSLSASCLLLGAIGNFGVAALIGVGILALVLGVLAGFTALAISQLPNIGTKMSEFATNAKEFFDVIGGISPDASKGLEALGKAMLSLAGAGYIDTIGRLLTGGKSPLEGFGDGIKDFAVDLGEFLKSINDATKGLGNTPAETAVAWDNIDKALGVATKMSEVAKNIPVTDGLVTKIAKKDLGSFGDQIGKFADGLSKYLAKISDPLGTLEGYNGKAGSSINWDNIEKAFTVASDLIGVAKKIPVTDGWVTKIAKKDLGSFGDQLGKFADGLAEYLAKISDPFSSLDNANVPNNKKLNWTNITKAMTTAKDLVDVASKVPVTDGKITEYLKRDLGSFGRQIATFATGLATYLAVMSDPLSALNQNGANVPEGATLNWTNITKATEVATKLAELAPKVPVTDGKITEYLKRDLGSFGDQIATFADSLALYLGKMSDPIALLNANGTNVTEVGKLNWDNITKATEAATDILGVVDKAPVTDGFVTEISKKDLGSIGDQVATFATGLATYLGVMSDPIALLNANGTNVTEVGKLDWTNITKATEAATDILGVVDKTPVTDGFVTEIVKKDLGSIGDQIATFATGLATYLASMSDPIALLNTNGTNVTEVGELNWDNITKATEVATKLVEMAPKLPVTDGLATVFAERNLGTFGTDVAEFATGLATYLKEISGTVDALVGVENIDNAEAVAAKMSNITAATGITTSLIDIANDIPDSSVWAELFNKKDLGAFGTQVSEFASGLTGFITSIKGVCDSLETTIGADGESAIDFSFIDPIISIATQLSGMAKTIGDNSAGWEWLTGKEGLDTFGTKIEALGTSLANFSTSIAGKESNVDLSAMTSAVTEIEKFVGIAERLSASKNLGDLSTLGDKIKSLGGAVKNFGANTAGVDASAFSTIATGLNSLANINVANADAIQSFVDSLGNVSLDGVSKFAASFENSAPTVANAVGVMMTAATNAVVSGAITLVEAITDMTSDAGTAAGNETAIGNFTSAGYSMAEGFATGISSGASLAVTAAVNMAAAAYAAACAELDINSPSKKFIWVGGSLPEGMALGIDKLSYLVTDSTTTMADKAIDSAGIAMGRLAEVVDSDLDSQPTIRPVVDLSEVTAGANAINGMFGMQPSVRTMANVGVISSSMHGRQNGSNSDIISAINALGKKMNSTNGDTYNVNGISYDDGSNVTDAVRTLVKAVRVERRK